MKKMILAVISLLLSVVMLTACGGGKEKASELTIYTALEDDQIAAYLEPFKQKNPDIKVNIVRDSTGVITAKLLAEKDNPQADVVWGVAATSLLVLDQNNMLEAYDPEGIERVQPEFKDTKKPAHWVGIDAWETAFVVNKREMEKRNLPIPQSYEDLTKPEYKGLITMPNPASSGTGFLSVSAFHQLYGEEKGWQYMDKLHNNIAMYTHSGSKPAKMAAQGEYPIGISFGYRGLQEKKKGAPVEVVFPKEGSGWDVEANALMKKKEIKPEAKKFLDWAITDEAMEQYNQNFAIVSVKKPGAAIPEGYSKDPMQQLIPNNLGEMAKKRDSILAEWEKRYQAKSEPKQ